MENQLSFRATTIDASASSSSTAVDSINSHRGDYRYDVFINHRGPDTKKTFASHLYRRFLLHGIRAFLDEQELQEGLHFPSQIVSAIRTASVHVAIFSPKYAESQWCLNELLLMAESGAPIIPVFYHVMPAELRRTQNRSGVYGEALDKLQMKKTYDPQTDITTPRYDSTTIQNWRNALSTFADTSGFDLDGAFNGDEGLMLDKVVERVVKMARKTGLYVAKYPTGLNEKVKDFENKVLRQQHKGKVQDFETTVLREQHKGIKAQVVGIVGCGGVGKTTLALEFFNGKCSEYENSYFLSDIRENAKSSLHLLQLQRDLLKGLTHSDQHVDNIHRGTQMLKEFLSSSQVLLILDDIDHEDQINKLLPEKDFYCSNSLILITSRDGNVLKRSRVEESSIYKLTGLTAQHSRELFCSYAFLQPYPLQGYEDLVDMFLKVCDGLPLSLKVFGGLLCGNNSKSFWEDTLHQVHDVPNDILEQLKISYDALQEQEQQIFLDIACFFIGEKRDMTIRLWDGSGWKGLKAFQNLESKCLVEVDSDNYIRMHEHLRDMGRKIALDKLPRRLWHPIHSNDDLLQQSSNEQVITEVRGIQMFPMDVCNTVTHTDDETLSWYRRMSHELFGNRVLKLPKLHLTRHRFLGIGAMNLQLVETEGHLLERILRRVHSPNLIWLSWRDCPYSYLPSWIPMKNLRVLRVEGKVFKTLWKGSSQAPCELRELEISGTLENISKSIGQLKHLERIVFDYVDLQKLPDEFYHLRSLKSLVLRWCPKLKALPESFDKLTNLQHIKLSECWSLETLPNSFGNWMTLQRIELSRCESLKRLPDSFGNLETLQYIKLSKCRSLELLPDSFGNLWNLQHIELSQCRSLERLPDSFCNLRNLKHMELSECGRLEMLPDSFGNLGTLQYIELSECQSLKLLPDSFGNLWNLQHMELSDCRSLERLPDSFGNLKNLQHIKLSECGRLRMLPDSFGNLKNLQHIELFECWRFETLPDSFGNLSNLQHVDLFNCWRLETLPNSFGSLSNLEYLNLSECQSLGMLPDLFGNLTNLRHMNLSLCKSLQGLPNSLSNLKNLQHINLYRCENLQRLPDSFGNSSNVQHIDLSHCKYLPQLISVETLVSLEQLKASFCVKLRSIRVGQLTKLKLLVVCGCQALEELEGVERCISLVKLNALRCPNLKWGEGVVRKLLQQKTTII